MSSQGFLGFLLLGHNSEIFSIGQRRLLGSRIRDPFLYQKGGFHHSITKYDEVIGQSAKTDFRFSRAKFIQGYSWMCNTMALLFVKQQQTIALAHGAGKVQNTTNPIDQKCELRSLWFTGLSCFKGKIVLGKKAVLKTED